MRSFKFLIYILTAFSILVLPADNTSFAATEYSQKNFLCNAVDGMKVILRSKYGDVTVHTWEQPRVRVSATITVDARNNNEAQEFIDRIDVKFKADSQKVEIISSIPRIPVIYEKEGFFDFLKGDSEIEVDIDIQIWVPARSDLDLETTKGEIVANGITGQIRASTTEEKIDLDNINGSVKAYTTESEIT
ncbi:MAG: hypothetical protein GY863_23135, partial [bacterium]|nr:hypothetical protein [bacterium]